MTRRRKFRGVNLWNLGEAYVQTSVLTQNFAGTDPLAFFIGKYSTGYGNTALAVSGTSRIGIGELIGLGNADGAAERAKLVQNVKDNWLPAALQTIGVRIGFAVAKRATRKMRSQINSGFKMAGIRSEVMV